MTKVINYHDIEEKTIRNKASLNDEEALVRALDLIDFYATLISLNDDLRSTTDNDGSWIELKYKLK